MSYCIDIFSCSYVSMRATYLSFLFRWACPSTPKVCQNNKLSTFLDRVDIYWLSSWASMRAINWSFYFMWMWSGMPKVFRNIKLSIFLNLLPTVSVKCDHFNLLVCPSFSRSVGHPVIWLLFYCVSPLMLCLLSNSLQIQGLLKFWLLRYRPKRSQLFTL